MMKEMENKHQTLQPPPVQRAMTAVREKIRQVVNDSYHAAMSKISGPELAEMDQAVLDDQDSYSTNTFMWAQAREDMRAVEDGLSNFPFPHFYSAPGVVGDYMENGLNPMIDEVINE
jgi:hypothetical protein